MKTIALIALLLLPAAPAAIQTAQPAPDIAGEWSGTIEVQDVSLRVVIHITKTDSGYKTTLDSPDQGVMGIPVDKTAFANPVVRLELTGLGAAYEGKLSEETIDGTWEQGGLSVPLKLTRKRRPGL